VQLSLSEDIRPDITNFRRAVRDPETVHRRVFGPATVQWWERTPGYVADEVKRALRRAPIPAKAKRDRQGRYKPLNYTLPLPSLAASSKRLAGAVVTVMEEREVPKGRQWTGRGYVDSDETELEMVVVETFTGPKAAEQYIVYRRRQLGLDLAPDAAGVAA
jgi:hypothetical protein